MAVESGTLRRLGALARWRPRSRHRGLGSQTTVAALLVATSLLTSVAVVVVPEWAPPSLFMLIELLGLFLLRLRGLVVLSAAIAVQLVAIVATGARAFDPGVLVVQALSIAGVIVFAANRDRLGLQGAPGDLMLVDLRDRLAAHGRIPGLPAGWRVDTAMRAANAEAFSGDFLVAARTQHGELLEIVLVDVSGKGQDAGVRSLLLSGAFGGLLGSMPRERFLAAANAYLLEQAWDEGFATAMHVTVRLDTGEFWVVSAGHPPAIHLHAGSGLLEVVDTIGGPALGIVDDLRCVERAGRLGHGDVLLLYTDGVVEMPGYDVELGIDRLMGVTERVVATRRGGAEAVLAGVRAGDNDDRALVLVHRD